MKITKEVILLLLGCACLLSITVYYHKLNKYRRTNDRNITQIVQILKKHEGGLNVNGQCIKQLCIMNKIKPELDKTSGKVSFKKLQSKTVAVK